ncbi:hypothetical protein [Paracoccus xiamenensis]|uniref:hypothetical protein n=1 Tax=Paracoccus xiamenensis TaxID=2714901 RepID=UPI001F19E2E8|nr:hypothetical protein [Paracoccus xiamenensis]
MPRIWTSWPRSRASSSSRPDAHEGRITARAFDWLPQGTDIKALTRLAIVYDLPMASSPATADCIVERFRSHQTTGGGHG